MDIDISARWREFARSPRIQVTRRDCEAGNGGRLHQKIRCLRAARRSCPRPQCQGRAFRSFSRMVVRQTGRPRVHHGKRPRSHKPVQVWPASRPPLVQTCSRQQNNDKWRPRRLGECRRTQQQAEEQPKPPHGRVRAASSACRTVSTPITLMSGVRRSPAAFRAQMMA